MLTNQYISFIQNNTTKICLHRPMLAPFGELPCPFISLRMSELPRLDAGLSYVPEITRPFDRRTPLRALTRSHRSMPSSIWQAIWRGAKNECPNCSSAKLFMRYLKPISTCPNCNQDWTHQQADDFPAYLSIFITGHLLAPIIIALVNYSGLPGWAVVTVMLSSAVLLLISLLQPAKGAVIAAQWWLGMHGFVRPKDYE